MNQPVTPAHSAHVCVDRITTLVSLDGTAEPYYRMLDMACGPSFHWEIRLDHTPGTEDQPLAALLVVCDHNYDVIHWQRIYTPVTITSNDGEITIVHDA